MANSGYDGVVRIDSNNTHGYQARVGRGRAGKTRFFADRKWGGPEEALRQALAWREQNLIPRSPIKVVKDRRNTSGVVGVRRKEWVSYSEGGFEYHDIYWEATWAESGKPRNALYPVKEHGEWGAFFKAVERRKVEEAKLLGTEFQPLSNDEIEALRGEFDRLDLTAVTSSYEKKSKPQKKAKAKARYSLCSYCNSRIAAAFCDYKVLREGEEQNCNKPMCEDCFIDQDGKSYCRPHNTLALRAAASAA